MDAIEIDNLRFTYPDGREALKGINLRVSQRESLGIIGPNGAGKTTLLLHLNGILMGTGQVRVLGLGVKKSSLKTIRSKVGLVFQDPDDQLFSATVFDDVSFGPLNMNLTREEVMARTKEALVQVGMDSFEQALPHHLSVGEKKRVAIATILSMKPEIMVLDEPSANLDPRQRRNLIALLKNIGVTKVVASHDLRLVGEICDRTAVLNDGRIVVVGATPDLLSNNDLMEANGLEALPPSVPCPEPNSTSSSDGV
jgi:cobalt/nickel transport system ATP-binding protein